jgi:WD40 repeat protein
MSRPVFLPFSCVLAVAISPMALGAQPPPQPAAAKAPAKTLRATTVWSKDAALALKFSRVSMNDLKFTPDGKGLAAGYNGGLVVAWDAATGRETGRVTHKTDTVLFTAAWGIAFSADSKRMISGSDGKSVRIWSLADGKEVAARTGLGFAPHSVALSEDGSVAAARAGSFIRGAVVWETATGKTLFSSDVKGHSHGGVGLSPDGKTLAFIDDREDLHLVDVPSGKDRKTVPLNGVSWKLHMSPDGKVVATWKTGALRFYSAEDGKELGQVNDAEIGLAWCFAGSDRVAAVCGKSVRVFAVPGGEPVAELQPDVDALNRIAVSPDGKLIAVVGLRKMVVVKAE